MRALAPVIFMSVLSAILMFIAGRWLNSINRRWWQSKLLGVTRRYVWWAIPVFGFSWLSGAWFNLGFAQLIGATGLAALMITALVLLFTLPVPELMWQFSRRKKGSDNAPAVVNTDRRRFLKYAAAATPLLALGTAGKGMAKSFDAVKVHEVPLYFPDLPQALDGLRILHFSDLHLGYYFQPETLEQALESAEAFKPDLLLVTGDIADKLNLLPDALRMMDQFNAPLGVYASLGNHEYIRGIKTVRRAFDRGPVPLLVNEGQRIDVNGSGLYLAGADDPKTLRNDIDDFLVRTTESSLQQSAGEDFKILLSHRPRALDHAAKANVDLVLSGHTHGGQVGMNGRSVFEGMTREKYMWGKYKIGKTQLYTSAGMGHWFPFRLNCPAEAPLIILRKEV